MKAIAIYLPQFHEVEENNQWWGKGFTDWVAVKKARPLFEHHREPRVPLNENYYDLSEHDTMEWQARLAKKYRVSGFCFYHYWFKDGRRILEKPAENLLRWTDIDMPFCFSWANQTWARTWTNIQNSNSWVGSSYDESTVGDGILLKQSYGGKKEWKEHFEYLLPFFKDSRYIRHQGKPVFLIYKPEYMYCLDNMMEYWKELAVDNGLKGLCIIAVRSNCKKWSQVDYWLMQEFDYSFMPRNREYRNGVWAIKYEDAWENILKRAYSEADERAFLGAFTDCDDTPRRGNRGVSVYDASPEVFEKYFRKIVNFSIEKRKEFIFINAWNEWGEGAYLEPDNHFQYGYLEAIKRIMDEADLVDGSRRELNVQGISAQSAGYEPKDVKKEDYEKIKKYYQLLNRWMVNHENDRWIAKVLSSLNMYNIAIYGMGDLGRHLEKELESSVIKVSLCFDKRSVFLHRDDALTYIKERYSDLDVIIVTPVMEYKDIRLHLKKFFDVPIMSLEELVYECEML